MPQPPLLHEQTHIHKDNKKHSQTTVPGAHRPKYTWLYIREIYKIYKRPTYFDRATYHHRDYFLTHLIISNIGETPRLEIEIVLIFSLQIYISFSTVCRQGSNTNFVGALGSAWDGSYNDIEKKKNHIYLY